VQPGQGLRAGTREVQDHPLRLGVDGRYQFLNHQPIMTSVVVAIRAGMKRSV